jgi:predicted ATPase
LVLEDIRPGSSGESLHIRDVGVGISQVLPIAAAALDPNRPSLTSIDGPELHLHPGFQVRVGELFASQVRSNTKGIFLLETHSEHIILRLQRRIRETASDDGQPEHELRADDVAVTYMHSKEDGTVIATRLRMDNKGEFLDNWPHGFFEESYAEIFSKQ